MSALITGFAASFFGAGCSFTTKGSPPFFMWFFLMNGILILHHQKTNIFLMKKLLFITALLAGNYVIHAQNVGINTLTPHPSSELDVTSSTKGFLAPRMTKTQRNAIASPTMGLLIYQKDSVPGFYVYDSSA
ncbi:MAG: hypothetical protein JSS64_02455 [Bacteroidetes bacterium]|nr:hypothetical protein [Bacteroidota bacterium]